jgi:hypothetical protein
MKGASDRLKGSLNGGAPVFVSWDDRLNQLFKGGSREASGFHNGGGDSLESILAEFQVFAAIGGCAPLAGCTHGKCLGGSGPDDHDIDGATTIIAVRVDNVGSLVIVVVRRDHLFAVDRCMSPAMEDFMEGVGNRLVPLNGPSAVGAAHGMVAFGITKPRTGCAVGAPQRAGSWSQDVVGHPDADGKIKKFIGHEVGGLCGKLQPRPGVRSPGGLPPSRQLWRSFGVGLPLFNDTPGGVLRESTLFHGLGWREREGNFASGAKNFDMEITREVEGRGERSGVKGQFEKIGMSRGVEDVAEA